MRHAARQASEAGRLAGTLAKENDQHRNHAQRAGRDDKRQCGSGDQYAQRASPVRRGGLFAGRDPGARWSLTSISTRCPDEGHPTSAE